MNRPLFPYPNSRDVQGPSPTDLHRFSIVGVGASTTRRFLIPIRGQSGVSNPFRGERDHREHTAKRCWNAVPYDLQRLPTVGEGSPLPRFNKSKTVCIVILEQSEGSADGFLHFLLSII